VLQHFEIKHYLDKTIGGAPKTQLQHLITIKAFFRWMRDVKKCLPYGLPTAAEDVQPPKVTRSEHEVYTPEEFMRLLAAAPANMVLFYALGQFAGIRSAERTRLNWSHWREAEGNNLVLNTDITKTGQRRLVDVMPNLAAWLTAFREGPDDFIVPERNPFDYTGQIAKRAGVPSKNNALRSGYASYHLELFDNAALTAKNDGHTVAELLTTYRSIAGVTKKSAREMFDITPQTVIKYASAHGLPSPDWAGLIGETL
jgi:integrase